MGSRSDWETMAGVRDTLEELGIPCEVRVVSAHRMPDEMFEYAESAAKRGLAAIIAGASIVGAQLGARYGRRLPPRVLRGAIVAVGIFAIVRLV